MFPIRRLLARTSFALVPVAFIANSSHAQTARSLDQACAAIATLALPQTRITRAEAVHVAGEYAVPGTEKGIGLTAPVKVHRSFCRVAGVVEPAITFETWMPLESWNGRFQGFGLGAFYGKLPYTPMAQSLDRGYAVGGTDTGHQSESDDGTWAMSNGSLNQQVVEDWAHRGIHEMSVKSQALVENVYGRPPEYKYFAGCSSGGFQAMTEAQRYPGDYDGILAGAPARSTRSDAPSTACRISSTRSSAGSASVSRKRATNSSPPYRAIKSLRRTVRRRTRLTVRSASSPAAWP